MKKPNLDAQFQETGSAKQQPEFGHHFTQGNGFFTDSWGRGPFVLMAGGKSYRFEDSDQFGPALLNKKNDLLGNPYPSERSQFSAMHMKWVKQGRRVSDDGISCVIDP